MLNIFPNINTSYLQQKLNANITASPTITSPPDSSQIISHGVSTSIGSIFGGLTRYIPHIDPIYLLFVGALVLVFVLIFYYRNFVR